MDDHRLMITDEAWIRMEAVLRASKSPAGAPPELSDRDFVEAISPHRLTVARSPRADR